MTLIGYSGWKALGLFSQIWSCKIPTTLRGRLRLALIGVFFGMLFPPVVGRCAIYTVAYSTEAKWTAQSVPVGSHTFIITGIPANRTLVWLLNAVEKETDSQVVVQYDASFSTTLAAGDHTVQGDVWVDTLTGAKGSYSHSIGWNVTAVSVPVKPSGPSPANGAVLTSYPTKLDWVSSAGASSYDVYLKKDSELTYTKVGSDLAASEWAPSQSYGATSFYWYVVAKNTAGTSTSDTWNYTVNVPPGKPGLVSPQNNAQLTSQPAKLDWNPATGAVSYDVYLDGAKVASQATASEWTLNISLNSGSHSWYVAARSSANVTTASDTWNFTILAPPVKPSGPSPANGAVLTSYPTKLDWVGSAGASGYDVYLKKGGELIYTKVGSDLAASEWAPSQSYDATSFYWYVVAKNTAGTSTSDTWNYTVNVPPMFDAEIIDFEPPTTTVAGGSALVFTARIKNTGRMAKAFWVGLSLAQPDAQAWPQGWYDVPPLQTPVLQPGAEHVIVFPEYRLPHVLKDGQHRAELAIWDGFDASTYRMLEPQYDHSTRPAFVIDQGLYPSDPYGVGSLDPDKNRFFDKLMPISRGRLHDLNAMLNGMNVLRVGHRGKRQLNDTDQNVIVLIHGWTDGFCVYGQPTVERTSENNEGSHLNDLYEKLVNNAKVQQSWSVVRYDWSHDARTSVPWDGVRFYGLNEIPFRENTEEQPAMCAIDGGGTTLASSEYDAGYLLWVLFRFLWDTQETIESYATLAAERAYQHGLVLGYRLRTQVGQERLRRVHLVAHSAGAWAAYGAMRYLRHHIPELELQVTYLDPYIPDEGLLYSYRTHPFMTSNTLQDSINLTKASTPNVLQAEVYHTPNDATEGLFKLISDSTTSKWTWSPANEKGLVQDVLWSPWGNAGEFGGHAGPVKFYAKSVDTKYLTGDVPIGWQRSLEANFLNFTRIIGLSGDLGFGNVIVGQSSTRALTIRNLGDSSLSVSGITYPSGFSGDWSGGTIAAGGDKDIIVTFAPTVAQTYSGAITVDSDKTSGTNMIAVGGTANSATAQAITFTQPSDCVYGVGPFEVDATASSGLPVTFAVVFGPATINGSTVSVTGAGTVTLRAEQAGNATHAAAIPVERSFTVAKASATVEFAALSQTYDRTPRIVSVTTIPPGLPVTLTYDGGETAPTNAGSYTVVATIHHDNYTGTASGSLGVAKASQTILFEPPASVTLDGDPLVLSASASSGLPVVFGVVSGPASLSGATLNFSGDGVVVVRVSQGGNANYVSTALEKAILIINSTGNETRRIFSETGPKRTNYSVGIFGPSGFGPGISWIGWRFTVAERVRLNKVMAGDAAAFGTWFAAVLRLDSPTAFPSGNPVDESELSGAPVVFSLPWPYQDRWVDMNRELEAGTYAVIFGTGAYGAEVTNGSGLSLYEYVDGSAGTMLYYKISGTSPFWFNYSTAYSQRSTVRIGVDYTTLRGEDLMAQTITFPEPSGRAYGDRPFAVSATASSGLPVTVTVVAGPATINGNVVTLTGAGTVTLKATQAGNASYLAAPPVERSFEVTSFSLHSARHAVEGGYVAGGTVTIANTLVYEGTADGLAWEAIIPEGWSFDSGAGAQGDVRPVAGDTGVLAWAWSSPPASPVAFTYTLRVPAATIESQEIAAYGIVRAGGLPVSVLAQPDPLVVEMANHHSADTNRDFRISLLELTRVIELYNTRNGTSRTGCYKTQVGTEDGFVSDPFLSGTAVVALAFYHAADSNLDGRLSVLELTRVIELFNYRMGTSRTGAYHVKNGSEDGYAPGPRP